VLFKLLIALMLAALLALVGGSISGLIDPKGVEHYVVPIIIPVLLAMDVVILVSARREHRERLEHIEEIRANTEQITRRDYELVILRGVQTATERIYCYWHSLHPVEQSETYKEINQGLIEKKKDGVDVRMVVAADPSRIAAAYELVEEGVEVEFKESLIVSDLRFSIFDRQTTVFGVPESAIKDGKPSRHGVDVSSRKLNALLSKYFLEEILEPAPAVSFDHFVASHCCEVLEDETSSVKMVAEQLRVPESVIEEACPEKTMGRKGSKKERYLERWRRRRFSWLW
jgi:hypothetical protein